MDNSAPKDTSARTETAAAHTCFTMRNCAESFMTKTTLLQYQRKRKL